MSEFDEADEALEFEADLDAPPEKVWRAVTEPALRERWLPGRFLADPEPVEQDRGRRVAYRMRDDVPPHLESIAVFELEPNAVSGTRLVIRHELTDARAKKPLVAANGNAPLMMRAA